MAFPNNDIALVLLASRLGPIRLLTPKQIRARPRSVRDAIGHLPPIGAGEVHENDRMHQSSALSSINRKRIRSQLRRNLARLESAILWQNATRSEPGKHIPASMEGLDWDGPAPTITTQFFGFGNGRFGHPEQDRAISLREGAILQAFPIITPSCQTVRVSSRRRLVGS